MSHDLEDHIHQHLEQVNDVVTETTKVEEPQVQAESVKPATYREVHTAENTTMKNKQEVAPVVTKFYKDDELEKQKEQGYLTFFLGSDKTSVTKANEIINKWSRYQEAKEEFANREIRESEYKAVEADWIEYSEMNFKGKTEEEIFDYCSLLYTFYSELLDGVKVRSKVVKEDTVNISDRGGFKAPDVLGKKPARNNAVTISEQMRRQHLNAKQDLYQFDILLRNSFINLTIRRPNLITVGALIQDIHKTVKGFVRDTNNPSINISYLAAVKAFWNYISNLIVSSSVKGVNDFKELDELIYITDVEALAVGIAKSISSKGFNLQLYCLQDGCGWDGLGLADVDKMLQVRSDLITDEEHAIYANLVNGKVKLSKQETRELSKKSMWLEDNTVTSEDGTYQLVIEPPTLSVGFKALEAVGKVVNPQIQKLRSTHNDPETYESELAALMLQVRPLEFIHWVSKAIQTGDTYEDSDDYVIERDVKNSNEFNEGLTQILGDDDYLSHQLMLKVMNRTPFMSRTFTGVGYFECPNCKTNSSAHDHKNLGYTPVNALMNFFTLTQLRMTQRALKMIEKEKEDEAL